MAKRFTDTEKWKDVWFEELSGTAKLMYYFYLDNCDCAGIWKGSFRQFEFFTGFKYKKSNFLEDFSGKVRELPNGSFFMPSFIKFQYGELKPYDKATSKGNKAHLGVMKCLNYNEIELSPLIAPIDNLGSTFLGVQEKEKEKEQDKDKVMDKDKVKEGGALIITPDELVQLWNTKMPEHGFKHCHGLGMNQHLNYFIEATNFLDSKEKWDELFTLCIDSNTLSGDNNIKWKANLLWLVNYDNALKVLNGDYEGKSVLSEINFNL